MSASGSSSGASGNRRTLGPRCTVSALGAAAAKPSARKCLFGPVDHQETNDFLREMNRKLDEQKKERWGFDFKAGRPVPGGHSVYEWVGILPSDDIPCAYCRMGESWRRSDTVCTENENAKLWIGEGTNVFSNSSDCSSDSQRKRLRRLSPCKPGQDIVVTKDIVDSSNAESGPTELEGASKPADGLPLKDLRKSVGKLVESSSAKLSEVPGLQERFGLPSSGPTKDQDLPKDVLAATDVCDVVFHNASYSTLPDSK